MNKLIPMEHIENKIIQVRGQKVMLDRDLAQLYGVTTKRLNEQIKRNLRRFPDEFMFRLTEREKAELVANCDRFDPLKHSSSLPRVFTEHGVAMLATVLHGKKAVDLSILIIKAFVNLRKILSTHKDLVYLFKELKHKVDRHDVEIGLVIKTIEKMIAIEKKPKGKIGFNPPITNKPVS